MFTKAQKMITDLDPDQSQNLTTSSLTQCLPFYINFFKSVNNVLRYSVRRQTDIHQWSHTPSLADVTAAVAS